MFRLHRHHAESSFVYDLSIENDLEAHVDALGNATRTRRWTFTNRTLDRLELVGWQMEFESTDQNIQVGLGQDSRGTRFEPDVSCGSGGQLRVTCNINTKLEPGEVYWLQVEYEQAEYFVQLVKSDCWLLNEWFARSGPERADPYVIGEPQRFSLRIHIPDIRPTILGIKDPTRAVEVDTNRVGGKKLMADGVHLQWQMNLRPNERSGEIYVLYHLKPRWRLLTPLVWAAGVVVGAISVEVLRVFLWGG
jgi:hypothetical protein